MPIKELITHFYVIIPASILGSICFDYVGLPNFAWTFNVKIMLKTAGRVYTLKVSCSRLGLLLSHTEMHLSDGFQMSLLAVD